MKDMYSVCRFVEEVADAALLDDVVAVIGDGKRETVKYSVTGSDWVLVAVDLPGL